LGRAGHRDMVRNEEERDGGAATRRPIRARRRGRHISAVADLAWSRDRPRVLATIDAIAERLTEERGLVYRYDTRGGADDLEGREGTFVLCTFWLAQALAG